MSTTARAYYNAADAARYLGVSYGIVMRALRCTDPSSFPPPLDYAGRLGDGGRYLISHDALTEWARSLRRFG